MFILRFYRNSLLLALFSIICLISVATKNAQAVKLNFENSGLYGGWNEYFVKKDSPFDFLIVQCWPSNNGTSWHGKGKDKSSWNDWLKRAYRNGKKVIMDLDPIVKKDKKGISLQGAYHHSGKVTIAEFAEVIDSFLSTIDTERLYAITLAEENVYWGGQTARLNKLYEHIKKKYPELKIFQWYTPGADVAGIGWPNLKADGWVIDEYFLDNPRFEYFVRGYALKKLPLISINWAAPDCKDVPYKEKRFWEQYRICRKYNIPVCYFAWAGKNIWGWSKNPPVNTKKVFELCKYVSELAKQFPAKCQDWDFVTYKPPMISLCCDVNGKPIAIYKEIFDRKSGVKFLKDAQITGFANLYWNSSPLKLYSLTKGRLYSTLRYTFQSPFTLKALKISLKGKVNKTLKGNILLSVFDIKGNSISKFPLLSETLNHTVPVKNIKGNKFKIEIKLTGQSKSSNQIPAEISQFQVAGEIIPPQNKVIELVPDALGNIEYSDDFSNLSIIHTAKIKNRDKLIVSPGVIRLAGINGYSNNAEIIQKFTIDNDKPVALEFVECKGSANPANYASSFGIGVSLDGNNIIRKKVIKTEKEKELILDLNNIEATKKIKEFYVHLYLKVACGVKTRPVCSIGKYSVKLKSNN